MYVCSLPALHSAHAVPPSYEGTVAVFVSDPCLSHCSQFKDLTVPFCRLVPDGSPRYWPIWTVLFTIAACFGFAFMAGQYGQYQVMTAGTTADNQQRPIMGWGPYSLGQWLVFWKQDSDMSFDFGYLLAWGGRWGDGGGTDAFVVVMACAQL